jgi:hypothetical protein
MLTLKECLLAELKPADGTSDVTASGEGYDETLHNLMQTFWDMFDSGQIMQTVTCSICTCVTTRETPFSKLLVQFPDTHHEATTTNLKCTLDSLIEHHFMPEDIPNYKCLTCSRRTLATKCARMSCYSVTLCIILGHKMNDETRITSAVNYPVIDFNSCTFFGSHEGTADSKYNLIATINHKPSKKNDGHYTAVNKSPTSKRWYKYDDNIVDLVKFVKWNTNSVLMDFQKTASILFYVNVKYVSDCQHNLCNDDEVIDITGHNRPPVIDQLQDATLSLFSSSNSSSLLSYLSSLLSSDNSSRSLTSVRSKTNSEDNNLFLSSSQLTKNCRSDSVDIKLANLFLSFCNWAINLMSEGIYNTPHQERCVARSWGGNISKMLPCAHKGCTARVHKLRQIDWLQRHGLEVVHNDPIFCRQHNECYQNYVRLHPVFSLQQRYPTSYSNPGAQGEYMYAWVFWYDKKLFTSINNVLVCYSYYILIH